MLVCGVQRCVSQATCCVQSCVTQATASGLDQLCNPGYRLCAELCTPGSMLWAEMCSLSGVQRCTPHTSMLAQATHLCPPHVAWGTQKPAHRQHAAWDTQLCTPHTSILAQASVYPRLHAVGRWARHFCTPRLHNPVHMGCTLLCTYT